LHQTLNKTLALLFIFFLAFTITSCSSSKHVKVKEPTAKKWTYFRILADADDDPIFVKLQDDLGIDPKMERYSIVVDIRSKEPQLQTITIGEDANPLRYPWSRVSEQVRKGLLNWTGNSKENLE
jgi:biopolymer transport protein ExbD